MDVSVILPVVNEGANLAILIPRLTALLDRERLTFEVIVVDGGSTDGTPETAQALGRGWSRSAGADTPGRSDWNSAGAGRLPAYARRGSIARSRFRREDVAGAHPR